MTKGLKTPIELPSNGDCFDYEKATYLKHNLKIYLMNLRLFILLLFSVTIESCFLFEIDAENEFDQEIVENLPQESSFQLIGPDGTLLDTMGNFTHNTWTYDQLYFNESDQNSEFIRFRNIYITSTGVYDILNVQIAEARFSESQLYYSNVSPDFWLNQGIDVEQGGYLNITSYSDTHISGNYRLILWRFSESLNREVGAGIQGSFENIPYQN